MRQVELAQRREHARIRGCLNEHREPRIRHARGREVELSEVVDETVTTPVEVSVQTGVATQTATRTK